MKQGTYTGDLTALQDVAFQIAEVSEKSESRDSEIESIKAIQAFINPKLYKQVYSNNDTEDTYYETTDIVVNTDSPESIDAYLEKSFKEAQKTTSYIGA